MKNFIKKIGAVFLSLTVTASLFAGCGAKTEAPAASAEDKGSFRTLDEIKSSGTINIGVPYPPTRRFWLRPRRFSPRRAGS